VRAFETAFLRFMDASYPQIGEKILSAKTIDAETETVLKKAIQEFKVAGTY